MSADKHGDFTPVMRVQRQHADVVERVCADPRLADCPLARALGPRFQLTLRRGIARRFPDKVTMFQQGELGGSLFLVLSGGVRLFQGGARGLVELPPAGPGELVGEAEVLDGNATRRATAAALGTTELLEFPREALLQDGHLSPAVSALLGEVVRHRSADGAAAAQVHERQGGA